MAARSPWIWLSAFASATASIVAGGTFAAVSAALRSASETNGTPSASCICACDSRVAGISGLSWMIAKNEALSAEMSTAPASAVPIEAPSWVPVF